LEISCKDIKKKAWCCKWKEIGLGKLKWFKNTEKYVNKEECNEVNDVTNKPVNKYTDRAKQSLYRPWGFQETENPRFQDNWLVRVACVSKETVDSLSETKTNATRILYSKTLIKEETFDHICHHLETQL
jgi:hypothetical protein